MLEIINYTTDTATEFQQFEGEDLQSYLDAHEGEEIGVSHCSIIAINSLDEAITLLDMSDSEHEQLEVVSSHCGYSYFDTVAEALEEFENINYIRIENADSIYQTACKHDRTIGYEDDLHMILGCDANSYEQLGSYISTDDIAYVLEREYSVIFANNSAYILL